MSTGQGVGGRVHAFTDDVLGELDAVGVADLIRDGQISAAEAVAAAIARAEVVEPRIAAVAFAGFEAALEGVGRRGGVFGGVPTFVKDNVDVRGMPTNFGTRAFAAEPAVADGPVGAIILAQGLVALGKSKLPEFGLTASTEFSDGAPTRNPWDTAYSVGASSGGSAALVASGVVPIAHANDGGGSIRIPAAACGLVGLKPTRGRVPCEKLSASAPIKIVADGVVTRSVRDTARFFAGVEQTFRAPKLPPIGLVNGPGKARLRVGLMADSPSGRPTDAETRAAVADAATLLDGLGHHVSEFAAPIPASFNDDFINYWSFVSFLLCKAGRHTIDRGFDPAKLDNVTHGLAARYSREFHRTPAVLVRLRRIVGQYARLFTDFDVLLSPVLSHTTPEIGHLSPALPFDEHFERLLDYVGFTPLNNASGGPAISLPMGATATGLPIGVHFSAPYGGERTLLELAFEIEQAQPWRRITV